MRSISCILLVLGWLLTPNETLAGDAFGAPLPAAEGEELSSDNTTTTRWRYSGLSLKEVEDFYKEKLQGADDIKWRDSKNTNQSEIRDWGARPWHKITLLDPGDHEGVEVTIFKDSWTWIMGTLIIRFVGVAVVLVVLMVALIISGKVISSHQSNPKTQSSKTG